MDAKLDQAVLRSDFASCAPFTFKKPIDALIQNLFPGCWLVAAKLRQYPQNISLTR